MSFAAQTIAARAQTFALTPTPFSGTPTAIPGTFEAENFDLGGEGVAYHDNTKGNAGGQYRLKEDVDIFLSTDSAGGGYVVANFETGEWLAYTVNVATSGNYNIELRAATNWDFPNSAYHVEIDGVNVTASVVLPNTGGWSAFQWVGKKGVSLAAGQHVLKIVSDQQYFNLNSIRVTAASTPFSGTPIAIPGTFEAENFDLGGEGVAYHDNTMGNAGGQYRLNEDVDIFLSTDSAGGGYVVSDFETGEWLAYTVNVATSGNYNIELRAATNWDFPNSAYHVEIDGVNVTASVVLPDTGGWSAFQWIGKKGVSLAAGQHVLKIVSDQQYFNLNSIRVTAASTPFSGTPIAIPGTFEAENFDLGGEGVAYHDNTMGNAGGQYRLNEDVDIFVSTDSAGGGYVVANFETGEWLAYTVNVATSGNYDIDLRAATNWDFPNSAYHVEIDGVNVTASVVLPNTGGWNTFQWAGKKTVWLSAGTHVLKLVSDQQYFNVNQIRILASLPAPGSAQLLFGSGFEGLTALSPVSNFFVTGAWQGVIGADTTTGFTWPLNVWGGTTQFQLIVGAPVDATTIGNYMDNHIETVTGHRGTLTQALYQEITQYGDSSTQDAFILQPASEQGDLYISFWMKFQPDLLQKMTPQNWRAFFEWKTAGDYRVAAYAASWGDGCGGVKPNGALFWQVKGDNNANGGLPYQEFWRVDNCSIAVPTGEWFKFEVFWHRSSGADGRVWMAINGQVIADHSGPNIGVNSAPINRIMMPNLYSGSPYPIYQWIDDLEIWNGFPPATGNNPPYAPH